MAMTRYCDVVKSVHVQAFGFPDVLRRRSSACGRHAARSVAAVIIRLICGLAKLASSRSFDHLQAELDYSCEADLGPVFVPHHRAINFHRNRYEFGANLV